MLRIVGVTAAAVFVSLLGWTPAQAQTCPPASVGGRTVATITVGERTVPVKSITFQDGGALNPPATNQAAGISIRNRPLTAKKGSTVITWHVRFGPGCPGALNSLRTLPIGAAFTAGYVGQTPATFRIAARKSVSKGIIKANWFRHGGPRKMVLITCDDYAGGLFRRTMAIVAVPEARMPEVTPPHGALPATEGTSPPLGGNGLTS